MTPAPGNSFTVGGTLSGLASDTLVLQNNGGDDLTCTVNGSFNFATTLTTGSAYSVTVLTQPLGHTCTVSNGSGTIVSANVTNVAVACIILRAASNSACEAIRGVVPAAFWLAGMIVPWPW